MSRLWIIPFACLLATPAVAADPWLAHDVHGSILALHGSQWSELRNGDEISSGVAVRALQKGRVVLIHDGDSLALGPNATIRLSDSDGVAKIEQFTGSVSLSTVGRATYVLLLPDLIATTSGAQLTAQVGTNGAMLAVNSGRVEIKGHGKQAVMGSGQTISIGAGGFSISGAAGSSGAADKAAAGVIDGTSAVDGHGTSGINSDNGVGNGGTPGNGGQNGNAESNGNSTDNGNDRGNK